VDIVFTGKNENSHLLLADVFIIHYCLYTHRVSKNLTSKTYCFNFFKQANWLFQGGIAIPLPISTDVHRRIKHFRNWNCGNCLLGKRSVATALQRDESENRKYDSIAAALLHYWQLISAMNIRKHRCIVRHEMHWNARRLITKLEYCRIQNCIGRLFLINQSVNQRWFLWMAVFNDVKKYVKRNIRRGSER